MAGAQGFGRLNLYQKIWTFLTYCRDLARVHALFCKKRHFTKRHDSVLPDLDLLLPGSWRQAQFLDHVLPSSATSLVPLHILQQPLPPV